MHMKKYIIPLLALSTLCSCSQQSDPTFGQPDPFLYPSVKGEELTKLRQQLMDIKQNGYALRVRETLDPNDARRKPKHLVYQVKRQADWDALIDRWLAVEEWMTMTDRPDYKISVSLPRYWVAIDFIDQKGRDILSVNMRHLQSYVYQKEGKGKDGRSCIYEDVMEHLLKDYPRLRPQREYVKKAQQGDAEAQLALAEDYLSDAKLVDSKPYDAKLGLYWLEQAAKQNSNRALGKLAEIYKEGKHGVTADKAKAAAYYQQAASHTTYPELRKAYQEAARDLSR